MRALWERVRSWVKPTRVTDEIDQEIAFHLEMEVDKRMRAGQSESEARRGALRDFGGTVQVRERVRDTRGMTFLDALRQDLVFGARTLRRSPGYTTAAVTILALGIGANTAMFSVLNGVLLKPLPFVDGARLVLIAQDAPASQVDDAGVSIPELQEYRARLASITDLVEYHSMSFTLLNQGEPDRVDTGVVSANFFQMLGITALHGRTFIAGEDDLGAEPVLILSHEYWMTKFGGDPNIVGAVFEMNNRPHTVVGVLPAFPQYPRSNDVYMPTSACPFRAAAERTPSMGHRSFPGLNVFGRLKADATLEAAATEVATVAQSFEMEHGDDHERYGVKGLAGHAQLLSEQLTSQARPLVWMLSGVTLLVLLIACANVANLSLARTTRRSRELAVRAALGAGRGRLIRQLLTESLILAAVGGALGIGVAWWSLDLLVDFVGRFTSRTGQIGIDRTVLLYSLLAALGSGLVFGLVPALATRRGIGEAARESSGQAGESRSRRRVTSALVVAQVAVSCVLLVGAALLLESAYRLSTVPLGFNGDSVLTATIYGNFSRGATMADAVRLNESILANLRATPGIVSAAITNAVPQSNIAPGQIPFVIEGESGDLVRRIADQNVASDGYFDTLEIPLLSGRDIRASDTAESLPVAVINASMARQWQGRDPVGTRFMVQMMGTERWYTVVGVVPDFRVYSANQAREVPSQYYLPLSQNPSGTRLLVRTSGAPLTAVPAVKAAVHAADPQIPVEQLQTLAELRNERLASPRLTTALLTLFAGVALTITLVGLAAVIGTSVTHRTREFGLRMALGATPRDVLTSVLGQGATLVGIGLALGVAGAYSFSEILSAYLFDTPPVDLGAYATVVVVFVLAGLIACAGPARRATSIDPLTSLRSE